MSDWLKRGEKEFADQCEKWLLSIENTEIRAAYRWDAEECEETAEKIRVYLRARAAYQVNDSTPKLMARDDARKEAMAAMREFANTSVRFNKHMSAPDRFELGVPTRDKTITRHGVPAEQPATVVENTQNHYENKITALNPLSGSSSKPDDAYGICCAYQVGGPKPAVGADIAKTRFTRKTNIIIRHTEAEKGKPVYYSTCYENSRGERGPWSPVVEAVIG